MVIALMALMVVFTILAACLRDLIRSAICLAVTSALLSAIIYQFGMPYAAAFELSVAAGLITVLFISTISLVKPPGQYEREIGISSGKDERPESLFHVEVRDMKMLKFLPFMVLIVAFALWELKDSFPGIDLAFSHQAVSLSDMLWKSRTVDLLGQIIVILSGIFLVVLFFKEQKE